MKNSVFIKFIAFVLCAASMAAVAAGGIGAIGVESYELHTRTPQQIVDIRLEAQAYNMAIHHVQEYTREAYTNLSEEELDQLFPNYGNAYYYSGLEALEIRNGEGDVVHAINTPRVSADGQSFTFSADYPMLLDKTVIPYSTEEVNMLATVTASTLNIRLEPDGNSDQVGQLYSGQQVWIYERITNSAWGRMDEGWINLNYVRLEDAQAPTEMPNQEEARAALVTSELLNVYVLPYTEDSMIVTMLDFNAQVWVYETQSIDGVPWGRIDEGWIQLDYVKYVEPLDTPATTADTEEIIAPTEMPALPTTEETQADEPAAKNLDPDLGEPLHYQDLSYHVGLKETIYHLAYYQGPELEVTVYLDEHAVVPEMQLLAELYTWKGHFIPVLLGGLLVFAMTFVYLCASAGRTAAGDIRPSGLNRVPLDVYLVGAISVSVICGLPMAYVLQEGVTDTALFRTVLGLGTLGIALCVVGFCFCFAAQVKVKGHYWWHHSLTGWCVDKLLWLLNCVWKGLCALGRGIRALFRMLPVVWQWLTVTGGLTLLAALFLILCLANYGMASVFFFFLFMMAIFGFLFALCYGAYAYGTLMKGVQYMAQGDLNHKVPTLRLYGTFRDFGEKLNSLGSAAQLAAQRQMKSERMKTELITNVSHDIKTPLTSIINFVDLLKKPHTPVQEREYLEVLDRQSQRLKKLIDDLMEMSKASTGNLAVELEAVDGVEAVNQALGEFSDKLSQAGLVPVFRHPETPVTLRADGRLVWRVLSNVLSNAVKYALPDTRLYIDLSTIQGNAVIAIKNISREQLNVDAGELMERFVRGDSSRNTEGSGLGLNIAKSLVELQGGQMHLMVDGDLFKVTLIFPLE